MKIRRFFLILLAALLFAVLVYQLPPVKSRLEWRIAVWTTNLQRRINPPEEAVFVPSGTTPLAETEIARQVTQTLAALLAAASPTPSATPGPTLTPTVSPTATLTPTAIPGAVQLGGVRHEYETWNNCGPATLGMQLSFWGWQGDQTTTAAFLKPNPRDKNVSPWELVDYVERETDFRAVYRVGGTQELLKQLVAAGFPVIVEKTLDLAGVDGWIGHYALITGYDDSRERFTTQDSYIQPDFPEPYSKLADAWRSFNYTFIVVYPPAREAELLSVLGPLADPAYAYEGALERASIDAQNLSGLQQYFAQFNIGSSLAGLQRFEEAAAAFDLAFSLYAQLAPEERPWRMVWYQHGPYESYYQTGRYTDIIALADTTLASMGEQTIEETFYWRGLAYEALDQRDLAIADLKNAVALKSNYEAAQEALARLLGE